jgi:hypothetical protein
MQVQDGTCNIVFLAVFLSILTFCAWQTKREKSITRLQNPITKDDKESFEAKDLEAIRKDIEQALRTKTDEIFSIDVSRLPVHRLKVEIQFGSKPSQDKIDQIANICRLVGVQQKRGDVVKITFQP